LKEKEEKRKKWKRTEVVSGNSKWAILLWPSAKQYKTQ
jgi:hypothetical protein